MRTNRVATCIEQVRDGHQQVEQAVNELRGWWEQCGGETTPPFQELCRRLIDLRPLLRSHFQDEESADHTFGLDDLPSPANSRAVLLADLDQLIARLQVCHPGMDCWADAEFALNRFLTQLSAHEARELATLPDAALTEDLPINW